MTSMREESSPSRAISESRQNRETRCSRWVPDFCHRWRKETGGVINSSDETAVKVPAARRISLMLKLSPDTPGKARFCRYSSPPGQNIKLSESVTLYCTRTERSSSAFTLPPSVSGNLYNRNTATFLLMTFVKRFMSTENIRSTSAPDVPQHIYSWKENPRQIQNTGHVLEEKGEETVWSSSLELLPLPPAADRWSHKTVI